MKRPNTEDRSSEQQPTAQKVRVSDRPTPIMLKLGEQPAKNVASNFLSVVKHSWTFENPYRNTRRSENNHDPLNGCILYHGPFPIIHQDWEFKWSIQKNLFTLERLAAVGNAPCGGEPVAEEGEMSFRLVIKTGTGSTQETKKLTFSVVDQKIDIAAKLNGYQMQFDLEANVRPENYAAGKECDVRILVFEKVGDQENQPAAGAEGKLLAEYSAHRSILAKRSNIFDELFKEGSESKETKEGVIRIKNYSLETVQVLLVFLYTGKVIIEEKTSLNRIVALVHAAEKYKIDEAFKKRCSDRLINMIDSRKVVELLTVAERFEMPELRQEVLSFIASNYEEVFQAENIQNHNEALRKMPATFRKQCSQGLSDFLTDENALDFLRLAERFKMAELRVAALSHVHQNYARIVQSGDYDETLRKLMQEAPNLMLELVRGGPHNNENHHQ